MFLTVDFFFFVFAACFGSEAVNLGIFIGSETFFLSFFQLASISDTRHLSASLSVQDNSVLSFCDNPVAFSVITSAARLCQLYHTLSITWKMDPHTQPTIHCTPPKIKRKTGCKFKITFCILRCSKHILCDIKVSWIVDLYLTIKHLFKFLNTYWTFNEKGLKLYENIGICSIYRTL